MRIVGGAWRGKQLLAPPGDKTRPTADRVRQALFDMLWHAPWAGRDRIEGAAVLDGFAGTGALGLEALSRGAATACFIEKDPAALAALRANIANCGARSAATMTAGDLLRLPKGPPCDLIFLDPPYAQGLVPKALTALRAAGRIADGALLIAEIASDEARPDLGPLLEDRTYGAARLLFFNPAGDPRPR